MKHDYETLVQKVHEFLGSNDKLKELIPKTTILRVYGTVTNLKERRLCTLNTAPYGEVTCHLAMGDPLDKKIDVGTDVCILASFNKARDKAEVFFMSAELEEAGIEMAKAAVLLNREFKAEICHSDLPKLEERSLEGLNDVQKELVVKYQNLPIHEEKEAKKALSRGDMKEVYKHIRPHLRFEAQAVLDDILSRSMNDRSEHRARILLSVLTAYEKEKVCCKEFRKELDTRVLGMDEVKEAVCEAVLTSTYTGSSSLKILLVGPRGVGKQTMAMAIAQARKKPYEIVPYGTFNNACDAGGATSLFDASKPGAFAEAFYATGTTDMTLILPAIDMATGKDDQHNGDPAQVLNDVLNGTLHDQYLECPVDTSKTWLIATATYEEDISPQIRNGFDRIFYIPSQAKEERMEIAKQFLIPELVETYHLSPNAIYITNAHLEYLVDELCYDQGMERLHSYLRSLILHVAAHRTRIQSTDEMDRILNKHSILAKPSAIVAKNILFFADTDRDAVLHTIEQAEFGHNETKERSVKIIKLLAEMFRNTNEPKPFDYSNYLERVNSTHSGLTEVKLAGARVLSRQANASANRGKNILLVGAPGVGKTTLLRSIAHAAGGEIGFSKISCSGVRDASFFRGTGASYKEPHPGIILQTLATTGTQNAMILLDEIDKLGSQEASAALLSLLDEKRFFDDFAGVAVDVSHVVFFATANTLTTVPEPLLNRFEVIEVPAYTYDEKTNILCNHLLPRTLAEYNNPDITFTDDAKSVLVHRYCPDAGARLLTTNLQKVIECVLVEHPTKYNITVSDLEKYLGPAPIEHKMCTEAHPGLVHGLAVSGYIGSVTDILIVHSKKEDKLTGLVEGSCKESVDVAKTAAATICTSCEDAHYHIHFGEGENGIRKDGSSAGLAMALCMISCETNMPIDAYTAFTGELSPSGRVFPIGGTELKITAAINQGCKRVVIPIDNYNALKAEDLAVFKSKVDVIPVRTLAEAYNLVMISSARKAG